MITYNMNTNNQKYWKNTKLTTILILAITILTLIHATLVFADNNIISNTKTVTHPPTEMIITTKKSETTPMPKNIIYVDDNNTQGPWDGTIEHPYQHIQDGINASTHHDIIYIFRGIYRENIIVNKSITLLGENRNHTIVDGTNKGIVADITANHVNIKNLTFRNSGGFAYNAGVILRKNSCHIDNCTFYRHRTSIYIENNSDNNIDSCIIHTNKKGILIDHSYNTTIQNCLFSHNAIALHLNHTSSIKIKNSYVYENGIGCLLHNTSKTLIHHCAINDNNDNQAGIIIKKCIRTKISNSNICHNGVGIKIIESSSINITKSDLKWNTHVAIQIKKSRKNITISNCEIAENLRFGAHATDSNCKFVKNNFYKNAIYGMFSRSSTCHAKLNWWGSITGPALTGLGPSDRITRIIGRVIYTPWLLRPLKNVGSDWATDDFFSKVNVSIERKRLVLPGLDSDGDGVPDWWEVKWGYDPLPKYREPPESPLSRPDLFKSYPYILNAGLRNPVYFHSEGRQLSWLREIRPDPIVEIHPETARKHGIQEGDWVWIESPRGRVKQRARLNDGIDPRVVVAEHGWWYPEIEDPGHGWDISNINILIDNAHETMDPVMGATNLRVGLCNISRCKD